MVFGSEFDPMPENVPLRPDAARKPKQKPSTTDGRVSSSGRDDAHAVVDRQAARASARGRQRKA